MRAFVMQAFILLLIVGTTIWIGVDASQRDWRENRFCNTAWKWVVGSLLLWIVIFPVYLVQRGRAPQKA
jgi:hypothetical protein